MDFIEHQSQLVIKYYYITCFNFLQHYLFKPHFQGKIVWQVDKPNGQPRRCLDTQRAKEKFSFIAETEFRQGLKNTINWYRQNNMSYCEEHR